MISLFTFVWLLVAYSTTAVFQLSQRNISKSPFQFCSVISPELEDLVAPNLDSIAMNGEETRDQQDVNIKKRAVIQISGCAPVRFLRIYMLIYIKKPTFSMDHRQ
jgi:hypothetical protein